MVMEKSYKIKSNSGSYIASNSDAIEPVTKMHYQRLPEPHFVHDPDRFQTVAEQRAHTILLFGGLTYKHERLIEGSLRGLGYNCQALPTPDIHAFELGKEYGNNAFCNPAYFTGGNVVKYLKGLEACGLSRREIVDRYAYLTAGYQGPCRFGLYEEELRLILRNAGFDGFRVILIKIAGGLEQDKTEAVININQDFLLGIINAIIMADVLGQLLYQIRPYEVKSGETDRVIENVLDDLHDTLRDKKPYMGGTLSKLLPGSGLSRKVAFISKFIHVLTTPYFTEALVKVRRQLDQIQIDPFRVCPIVKIVGEFSAAIAEGDMNYSMFNFLEQEGAEILLEPVVSTQLMRWLHLHQYKFRERRNLYKYGTRPPLWRLDKHLHHTLDLTKKEALLGLASKLYRSQCGRFQRVLGGSIEELPDIQELAILAEPYYNWRCGAGETHLEVGHNVRSHAHKLCHMVLSLKPFGCLPSTQSDGAQVAVLEEFKDINFLSIETSGEGEVLAHSRALMALDTAKEKASQEFEEALAKTGKSLDQLRNYVDRNLELQRPTYRVPPQKGITGRAAKFVLHIADLMNGNTRPTSQGHPSIPRDL